MPLDLSHVLPQSILSTWHSASSLAILFIVAVVVLALIILFTNLRHRQPRYEPQMYLFTKTEWRFAQALHEAAGNDFLLMGKVRIADVLKVESHSSFKQSDRWRKFVKISSKHVDYVMISRNSGRIQCCIELDDASHQRKDRMERDAFVNHAFQQAGLPLLRFKPAKHYDPQQIKKLLHHSRA